MFIFFYFFGHPLSLSFSLSLFKPLAKSACLMTYAVIDVYFLFLSFFFNLFKLSVLEPLGFVFLKYRSRLYRRIPPPFQNSYHITDR